MAKSGETRSAQHLGRLLPRTQREFRRHFLNDWRYALKTAQGRPKYHVSDPDLRVFVISLERVPERKLETVRALETQGIQWATHRAVDGLDDLKRHLLETHRDAIAENVIRRLVSYGLGRKLNWRDTVDIEKLITQAKAQDYRFRDTIVLICQSRLFRSVGTGPRESK